jgi:hypothetical protein
MKIPFTVKLVSSFGIIFLIAIFLIWVIVTTNPLKDMSNTRVETKDDGLVWVSGNITDKFITGTNELYYYFVIEDSYDIHVSESLYYSCRVGDVFSGRIGEGEIGYE